MTISNEFKNDIEKLDIVKLEIDGSEARYNTICDAKTKKGLSLICPFPALEVDLPIGYRTEKDGKIQRGTIHRITVEDDPHYNLPRLRLSVRNSNTRPAMAVDINQELLEKSAQKAEDCTHNADTDPSLKVEGSESEEEKSGTASKKDNSLSGWLDMEHVKFNCADADKNEPAWIDCTEMPLPAEMMAKSRKKWINATFMAWFTVLAIAGFGGYMADRTGLWNLAGLSSKARYIANEIFSNSTKAKENPIEKIVVGADKKVTKEEAEIDFTKSAAPKTPQIEIESATMLPETKAENDVFIAQEEKEEIQEEVQEEIQEKPGIADEINEDSIKLVNAEIDKTNDEEVLEKKTIEDIEEISMILPLRWPAQYSSGYRVNDPNGVVVDIPGGLVKREGWLNIKNKYEMVRSVKVIQRETGARFIIYINGDLPGFKTTPLKEGLSLTLYRTTGKEEKKQTVIASNL